ncbi:MAG TPA: hypothetical protein VFZ34_17980 [Blastocatellia bacterium]|nr:hypothetical protein [Blastocatellia bacterium]
MGSKMAGMKKTTALLLVVAVGAFQSLITGAAMAQVTPKLAGNLSVRGLVTLNGVNVGSGATVFDGGQIKTGNNGTAIVSLGKMGQVELAADSELVLKLDAGTIGGNLRSGQATVSAPAGVGVNILTTEGVAVAEGRDATVMTVDVACGNTRVSSSRSDAKVTSGNRVEIVAAGQEVAVGAQATGNPQRCPRLAAATARVGATTALSGGALAALILVGIGGAVAGIIAATQGDDTSSNVGGVLSRFAP